MKKNDVFKIDTYRVPQYGEKRVVSQVRVLETPRKTDKRVLCYVEHLRADCLIFKSDLK